MYVHEAGTEISLKIFTASRIRRIIIKLTCNTLTQDRCTLHRRLYKACVCGYSITIRHRIELTLSEKNFQCIYDRFHQVRDFLESKRTLVQSVEGGREVVLSNHLWTLLLVQHCWYGTSVIFLLMVAAVHTCTVGSLLFRLSHQQKHTIHKTGKVYILYTYREL